MFSWILSLVLLPPSKVRQALKDDPDQPGFIQTSTGKGNCFVAERNGGDAILIQLIAWLP